MSVCVRVRVHAWVRYVCVRVHESVTPRQHVRAPVAKKQMQCMLHRQHAMTEESDFQLALGTVTF